MKINQKNTFGDNIINLQPIGRVLNGSQKKSIVYYLKKLSVKSVSLQFEHSGETQELAQNIATFLRDLGFSVYGEDDIRIGTGIKRGEFSISKHPTDFSFALIKIGSIF